MDTTRKGSKVKQTSRVPEKAQASALRRHQLQIWEEMQSTTSRQRLLELGGALTSAYRLEVAQARRSKRRRSLN